MAPHTVDNTSKTTVEAHGVVVIIRPGRVDIRPVVTEDWIAKGRVISSSGRIMDGEIGFDTVLIAERARSISSSGEKSSAND
jgi:hypothetical protein